jgi:hypothetical protein
MLGRIPSSLTWSSRDLRPLHKRIECLQSGTDERSNFEFMESQNVQTVEENQKVNKFGYYSFLVISSAVETLMERAVQVSSSSPYTLY